MKLREARLRRYMTIRELAEKAGVSTRTIVMAENGKSIPFFATSRKIAAALGVEISEIEEFVARIDEGIDGLKAAA